MKYLSLEPIAKLNDPQNRPFKAPCARSSSPALLGRPPPSRPDRLRLSFARCLKIIDFSLSWGFAIGSLLFPLYLFGAYVGNPANPAIMNTGIFSTSYPFVKGTSGYIYDYTSNKYYEAEQQTPDFNPNQVFRELAIRSQLASFSIILVERMELFGSAGGSKEEAKGRTTPSFFQDFQTEYHFSWSAGTKVVLIQWGKTYLSCDFTYFAIPESSKSFFKFLNRLNLPIDFTKHNLALREWQFSGALSSRFLFFTPYLGMTYLNSHLHVEPTPETGPIEYKNRYTFGWFYGFTISLTGRFHLNFEQRLRDELGYTFSSVAVF